MRATSVASAMVGMWVAAFAGAAQAAPVNLVSNGTFDATTGATTGELLPSSTTPSSTQAKYVTTATSWYTVNTGTGSDTTANNQGYPFLFITSNAVTTGFGDAWDSGVRYLWGASSSGLAANSGNTWDGTSSSGGNYLVMDADYHHTAISQAVGGLVKGTVYQLTFDWGAAQWYGFSGATTESLAATLGGQTQSTAVYNLGSNGFSGWLKASMTFAYDGTSNVLSFLASGGPVGSPPVVVLDNVSLVAVPEPTSIALFGAALLGVGGIVRRRRNRHVTG